MLTDNSLNQELVVIGMMKTPGKHNSETIKLSVETMVNSYEFDKSKIIGILFILMKKYFIHELIK